MNTVQQVAVLDEFERLFGRRPKEFRTTTETLDELQTTWLAAGFVLIWRDESLHGVPVLHVGCEGVDAKCRPLPSRAAIDRGTERVWAELP